MERSDTIAIADRGLMIVRGTHKALKGERPTQAGTKLQTESTSQSRPQVSATACLGACAQSLSKSCVTEQVQEVNMKQNIRLPRRACTNLLCGGATQSVIKLSTHCTARARPQHTALAWLESELVSALEAELAEEDTLRPHFQQATAMAYKNRTLTVPCSQCDSALRFSVLCPTEGACTAQVHCPGCHRLLNMRIRTLHC